jgi:hypothetical protein
MTPARLLLVAALFASPALALQPPAPEGDKHQPVTPEERAPSLSTPARERTTQAVVSFNADHSFATDFDEGPGEFAATRAGGSVRVAIPAYEKAQVAFDVGYDRWEFDFKDATTLDAADGEPWSGVNDVNATVTFANRIDDQWSYVTGAFVRSAFADGADAGEGFTFGGILGVTYAFSDRFSLGGGLIASSVIEDDWRVLPIMTIDWKINDKLSLRTNPGVGRRIIGLSYQATDALRLTLGTGSERVEFRLEDDGPEPKGVGRFSRLPVALDVTYDISHRFSVNGYVGYLFSQEVVLDTEDGDRVRREDADPAFGLGAGVSWRF